ncbi:DUF6328 family protein [Oerskovia flava]|uniref:DUF6328 family protein n=1 Tax=Oerskovia flava TaxID=2986422 RepID=UPI00223F1F1F|nr:DUF6328 family protein [Oerskovia sp. JB1-3-2]
MGTNDAAGREQRDDGRHESVNQRLDRNWNELLQELRVTQTGVQILTGFLLTVPFQQRFTELDDVQRGTYLVLVVLAALATGFLVAPVSLHRFLFRRGLKLTLVTLADRLARCGLLVLGVLVSGCTFLLFDVVAGRAAGIVVGACVLAALAGLWLVLPVLRSRDAARQRDPR